MTSDSSKLGMALDDVIKSDRKNRNSNKNNKGKNNAKASPKKGGVRKESNKQAPNGRVARNSNSNAPVRGASPQNRGRAASPQNRVRGASPQNRRVVVNNGQQQQRRPQPNTNSPRLAARPAPRIVPRPAPAGAQVIMGNLPNNVTDRDIKTALNQFKPTYVSLLHDSNNAKIGKAIIRFENAAVAKQVVNMFHGGEFGGKKISVTVDN